ncbi:hypothetical protein BJ742DRAFT_744116 [Cladochytrium replicatum]|nr:hypothetical protein BJ742DRAFT_744116 [Cladochytrium replicatum]
MFSQVTKSNLQTTRLISEAEADWLELSQKKISVADGFYNENDCRGRSQLQDANDSNYISRMLLKPLKIVRSEVPQATPVIPTTLQEDADQVSESKDGFDRFLESYDRWWAERWFKTQARRNVRELEREYERGTNWKDELSKLYENLLFFPEQSTYVCVHGNGVTYHEKRFNLSKSGTTTTTAMEPTMAVNRTLDCDSISTTRSGSTMTAGSKSMLAPMPLNHPLSPTLDLRGGDDSPSSDWPMVSPVLCIPGGGVVDPTLAIPAMTDSTLVIPSVRNVDVEPTLALGAKDQILAIPNSR